MTRILIWAAGASAVAVAAYAVASAYGGWRWSGATRALVAQMEAGRVSPTITRYHASETAGLPAPVQRYFQAVLTDGQPIIATAQVAQKGVFNMSATAEQWKPFTASQVVETNPPGFVWNAKIIMVPGVAARVVDAYVSGSGTLRPSILGLFPLADMHGTGEIARGELMRWFSEAIWYPTALLPSQGVAWTAVDDRSANATVAGGPLTLTLLFRFGADGLIASIHADARAQMDGARVVMAPWECTMSDYRRQDGMQVPFAATAGYVGPSGVRVYFRGSLLSAAYSFAE